MVLDFVILPSKVHSSWRGNPQKMAPNCQVSGLSESWESRLHTSDPGLATFFHHNGLKWKTFSFPKGNLSKITIYIHRIPEAHCDILISDVYYHLLCELEPISNTSFVVFLACQTSKPTPAPWRSCEEKLRSWIWYLARCSCLCSEMLFFLSHSLI